MKFLFVYPNPLKAVQEQLGIGYLVGQLEKNGVEVKLWDNTFNSLSELTKELIEWKPNYVGISTRTSELKFSLDLAKLIKDVNAKLEVLIGGVGPSLEPDVCISDENIDAVFVGESEKSLVDYIRGKEGVPGVIYKDGGNYKPPITPDLDKLAWPNHQMWIKHFVKEGFHGETGKMGSFLSSRGCPYNCTYCSNRQLRDLHEGKWSRFRDPKDLVAEILKSKDKFDIDYFYFADDTFTFNKEHVIKCCEGFEEIGLPFYCMARCNTVDKEMLEAMKNGGCKMIMLGIESGSERIRREVLNRKMTNDEIKEAFFNSKKVGLRTLSFNMVGYPSETYKDFLSTMKLNLDCKVDEAKMTIFQAFPQTPIWHKLKSEGKLREAMPFNYYEGTNIIGKRTEKELVAMQTLFYRVVNGK